MKKMILKYTTKIRKNDLNFLLGDKVRIILMKIIGLVGGFDLEHNLQNEPNVLTKSFSLVRDVK